MPTPALAAAHPNVIPSRYALGETVLLALARVRDTEQRERYRALASVVLQKIAEETSASVAAHCFLGRIVPTVLRGLITAGRSSEARRLSLELDTLELIPPIRLADYPEAYCLLRDVARGLASYEAGSGSALSGAV